MPPLVCSSSEFQLPLPSGFWASLLRDLSNIGWPGPEVVDEEQAIVLDGGIGPAWLLTSSGRLWAHWDDPLTISIGDAYRAIVVGWRKTKVDLLLTLLPDRPRLAVDCHKCRGNRFFVVNPHDDRPEQVSIVCDRCDGLAWLLGDLDS